MRSCHKDGRYGWPAWTAGIFLMALAALFFLAHATVMRAQGGATATVARAVKGHGPEWQDGTLRSWAASGTLTLYRYDPKRRQVQETFPAALIHTWDASAGGQGRGKLQRLIFRQPDPLPKGAAAGKPQNPYAPDRIQMKEGTDGTEQWLTSGTATMRATGASLRFIEAHTVRSIEALLNSPARAGVNLEDVTSAILSKAPAPGTGKSARDRSLVTPAFEAARNRRVIEMREGPTKEIKVTRFYIDDGNSLVARMEFDFGAGRESLARQILPLMEVYEFSDYRDVLLSGPGIFPAKKAGEKPVGKVKFPFMIERYVMGEKIETMVFQQVTINAKVRAENFQR